MRIVTGYQGEAHITSADIQGFNSGIVGVANWVLSVGSSFAATIVSANKITIADGEGCLQGVHFRIPANETEDVAIENGTQGKYRNDLICARYTKDSDGVEDVALVVIKGTAGSSASDPSYNEGNVRDGSTQVDFPLYRVSLNGLTVASVTALFDVVDDLHKVTSDIETLNTTVAGIVGFPYVGTVSNLNNATSLGRYFAGSSASNGPGATCWFVVFPFGSTANFWVQAAWTSSNVLYTRVCNNGTWTAWATK